MERDVLSPAVRSELTIKPAVEKAQAQLDHPSHGQGRAIPRYRLATISLLLCLLGASSLPGAARASVPLSFSAPEPVDARLTPSAISCPSLELCVVADQTGEMLFTADPASPFPIWSVPEQIDRSLTSPQTVTSLSCASQSLCVVVDSRGDELTSTDPLGGAGTWQAATIDVSSPLRAVSCATTALCVAVDESGHALTSTDPGAVDPTWNASDMKAANPLRAISCPTESLCVAVDEAGDVLTSTDPAAGASASWQTHDIDPAGHPQSVSCSTIGSCVVLDSGGDSLASANPASEAPTWSETKVDLSGELEAVSCTFAGFCVAVDAGGHALTSDEPTAAIPSWDGQTVDAHKLLGTSCLPEGFCMTIDSAGEVLQAFLAAPVSSTTGASEVAIAEETLTGTIDPNHAQISGCRFEYGTSTEYGQSVPCSNQPLPAGGTQTVSARIGGLNPASTYHYRVRAADAAGTGTGADETFTTAAAVVIEHPTPTIVGVPAVGERLRCLSGITSTAVTLTYLWYHDTTPISATDNSTYQVRSGDAKHHLQCRVTATDTAGSASANSAFVAIPAQGILASVGESTVGKAVVVGKQVLVPVQCSPDADGGCVLELKLTLLETRRGNRIVAVSAAKHSSSSQVKVTVASAREHMSPGQRLTVSMTLSRTAQSLLARMHRLPAELTVTGTVIGALKASLARQRVTLMVTLTHSASRRI